MEEINEAICSQIKQGVQNSEIVKTINLLGSFLNAETIPAYRKRVNKDYTSVKYAIDKGQLESFELFGVTYVIDNL